MNNVHQTKCAKEPVTIKVENLVKTYGNDVKALDGLTFSVKAGAIFGFLGPNGAGKSTAVHIMTTLVNPDHGKVTIAGMDIISNQAVIRQTIGCVAQKSGVDLLSTGRENLTLQGQIYGLRGSQLRTRVSDLLERFHLTKVANRPANTYSGGMQRKLDIAMGLIHRPRILFLDEPTTGLDPESRTALWESIRELAKEEGLTVLITTHYLEEADQLADEVAIIDHGKIIIKGNPEKLKAELHGDILQLELSETNSFENIEHIISDLPEIQEIMIENDSVYIRTDSSAKIVAVVLGILEKAGVNIKSTTISRPTLDDVYMKYTGKTLSKSEGEVDS